MTSLNKTLIFHLSIHLGGQMTKFWLTGYKWNGQTWRSVLKVSECSFLYPLLSLLAGMEMRWLKLDLGPRGSLGKESMVESNERWNLSLLYWGVTSHPWTALFRTMAPERNTFLSCFNHYSNFLPLRIKPNSDTSSLSLICLPSSTWVK